MRLNHPERMKYVKASDRKLTNHFWNIKLAKEAETEIDFILVGSLVFTPHGKLSETADVYPDLHPSL